MPRILGLGAREILDSRGRPTLAAFCALEGGASAQASVPSGASTGTAEAVELRDGDPSRYGGLGCLRAAESVNCELRSALVGREFAAQTDLDRDMTDLDGTPDRSRLGANAILAVSIAFARACAAARRIPLYRALAEFMDAGTVRLPRLTINLFSGGRHAGGQVPVQDVLIVPHRATIDESLSTAYAVYQSAVDLTRRKYAARPLVADEGGLAPPFRDAQAMLQDAVESIRLAGLRPGEDVSLAIDVAATQFFREGIYHLGEERLSGSEMIERIAGWIANYPILSVEDGLAEEAWEDWPSLRRALGGRANVMGDDLLCTRTSRIERAIRAGAADALLLKVNQVGTLTEAAQACRMARAAGWKVTVSARSGETEDDWLADLAVGWSGDFIKIGSITRSERLAKYNRLLAIEAELSGGSLG